MLLPVVKFPGERISERGSPMNNRGGENSVCFSLPSFSHSFPPSLPFPSDAMMRCGKLPARGLELALWCGKSILAG